MAAATWTDDSGSPGFTSIRFTPAQANFRQERSEVFAVVVSGFDVGDTVELMARSLLSGGGVGTPTPLPTVPFSPLPTPTPTPEDYALSTEPIVPECVFVPPPEGIPDEPIIPLDAYSFSEPQEVITHTAPIGIQNWLLDNETLLITRESLSNLLISVELVNTETGKATEIVEPRMYLMEPRWLLTERSLVWRQTTSVQYNESGYWIRSTDPPMERRLSENATGSSIGHDVSPDGKKFVFMSLPGGTQPLIWNQETKLLQILPIDLSSWRYVKGISYPIQTFYSNWHPHGDKILFWDGTWIFLYDLTTNNGCEIDLNALGVPNHYVHEASWSPNGRYLLLKNAATPPYIGLYGPHDSVLILDTYNGNTFQYALDNTLANFSWAPDSQIVAIHGGTGQKIGGSNSSGFYLLNVRSGEYRRILAEQKTLFGMGKMIKWSPNGKNLAIQCMDTLRDASEVFDRICVSRVSTSQ